MKRSVVSCVIQGQSIDTTISKQFSTEENLTNRRAIGSWGSGVELAVIVTQGVLPAQWGGIWKHNTGVLYALRGHMRVPHSPHCTYQYRSLLRKIRFQLWVIDWFVTMHRRWSHQELSGYHCRSQYLPRCTSTLLPTRLCTFPVTYQRWVIANTNQ